MNSSESSSDSKLTRKDKIVITLIFIWLLMGGIGVILGIYFGGHHYTFDQSSKDKEQNSDLSVLYLDIESNYPYTWGKDCHDSTGLLRRQVCYESSYNLTIVKYSLDFDVWDNVTIGPINDNGSAIQVEYTTPTFEIKGMVINYNTSFTFQVYKSKELSRLPETLKEQINSLHQWVVEVYIHHAFGSQRKVDDFDFKYLIPFGLIVAVLLIYLKIDEWKNGGRKN